MPLKLIELSFDYLGPRNNTSMGYRSLTGSQFCQVGVS